MNWFYVRLFCAGIVVLSCCVYTEVFTKKTAGLILFICFCLYSILLLLSMLPAKKKKDWPF